MSGLNPNRYPVDYTGTASTNLIANEAVTLSSHKLRTFSPANAPYFKKNIVIKDTATGLNLTTSQYACYFLNSSASAIAGVGNEVYNIVVITDQAVSPNILVTYQTVGGDYIQGFDAINAMLASLTLDSRPAQWDNILNRPTLFSAGQHLHPTSDLLGWEFLASAIEQLTLAVQLGDDVKKDFILSYIDMTIAASNAALTAQTANGTAFGNHVLSTANPHSVTPTQLGLGNVANFALATLAEVYAGVVTNKYVTVDQVASAVHNAVNLGMDAHIARTDNPHNVTAAQVGLGLLQNLAVAALADLNTPNAGSPLYVTNVVLAQWLNAYFVTQQTSIAATIASLTTQINSALTAAQTAQTSAQTAQSNAQAAATQAAGAVTTAASALSTAQSNTASITGTQAAATALVQSYTATAIQAARSAGYSQGYADGLAAQSHS